MKKIFISLMLILTFTVSIGISSVSYAAPGSADLNVTTDIGFLGAVLGGSVCNVGDEDVEQFTFTIDSISNYSITTIVVNPDPMSGGSTATDPGDIDQNTGVWTGLVKMGECVIFSMYGDITGNIGEDITFTVSASDSFMTGATTNIDPNNTNDQASLPPYEIVERPDIAVETRLLTKGQISSGSTVSYEVIYKNVGNGTVPQGDSMFNVVSFLFPSETSITGIEDGNLSDNLSSDFSMCFVRPTSSIGAGLSAYTGSTVSCLLTRNGDLGPNTSYPFKINLTASADFVSGAIKVYAIGSGQDIETAKIQREMFVGDDPFITMQGFNNLSQLTYDNGELVPFVSLCAGQGSTTTDGNGCFRITFNKLIWEESFEIGDLNVTAGTISDLKKIDDYTWEVRISSIPKGQTAELTLIEGSVLDYSAVVSVKVLGENRIRFAADEGALQSTLPETGSSTTTTVVFALFMIISGFGIINTMKRRYAGSTV